MHWSLLCCVAISIHQCISPRLSISLAIVYPRPLRLAPTAPLVQVVNPAPNNNRYTITTHMDLMWKVCEHEGCVFSHGNTPMTEQWRLHLASTRHLTRFNGSREGHFNLTTTKPQHHGGLLQWNLNLSKLVCPAWLNMNSIEYPGVHIL